MRTSNKCSALDSDSDDVAPKAEAHETNTDSADKKAAKPKPKPMAKSEGKKPAVPETIVLSDSDLDSDESLNMVKENAKKEKKERDVPEKKRRRKATPRSIMHWETADHSAVTFSELAAVEASQCAVLKQEEGGAKPKAELAEKKKTKAPQVQGPQVAAPKMAEPKVAAPKVAAAKPAAEPKQAAESKRETEPEERKKTGTKEKKQATAPKVEEPKMDSPVMEAPKMEAKMEAAETLVKLAKNGSDDGQGLAPSKRKAESEEKETSGTKVPRLTEAGVKEPTNEAPKDAKVNESINKVEELEVKVGPKEKRSSEIIGAELKPIAKKVEDVHQAAKGCGIVDKERVEALVHAFHCTDPACQQKRCADAKQVLKRMEVHVQQCPTRRAQQSAQQGGPPPQQAECKVWKLWQALHRTKSSPGERKVVRATLVSRAAGRGGPGNSQQQQQQQEQQEQQEQHRLATYKPPQPQYSPTRW
jgi:hypothetical protein